MVETRTPRSIKILPSIWKAARKHCIDEGITVSVFIERLISERIKVQK